MRSTVRRLPARTCRLSATTVRSHRLSDQADCVAFRPGLARDDFIFRFRSADGTAEQVVEFLFTWFAMHTTRQDKRIADYMARVAAAS